VRRQSLLIAGLLLGALQSAAGLEAGSVELRGAAGPDIWSAGGSGSQDFGAKSAWTLSATEDHTDESTPGSPSRTDLASLELADTYSPAWTCKIGADFSNDSVNQILYAGPDLGVTWNDLKPRVRGRKAAGPAQADDADAATWWSLAFDASIHGYDVNLGANQQSGVSRKTKLYNGGVPYTVQTTGSLDVTQFYPNLACSVPLAGGSVVPELLYGHDFYSEDPGTIATVVNRRFSAGSGNARVGNLVGALYTDTLTASLGLKLFWGLALAASWSESQLISPYVWASTAEASVTAPLGQSLSVRLGWTDTTVEGQATPEGEAAVTASF
jgi:hypothetical protein